MPLRRELKPFYDGHGWRRFREEYAATHPKICAVCQCRDPLMNLAHLTHDPLRRDFICWLCPRCHGIHDTPQRIALTRRTKAKKHGQLWLWPEVEFAPELIWLIPADLVIPARQEEMFRPRAIAV
jgi:hypothetical protein